jgi:hypothetical protein
MGYPTKFQGLGWEWELESRLILNVMGRLLIKKLTGEVVLVK